MKVILASKNQHKLTELSAILSQLGFEIALESEYGLDIDVEETGTTFEENSFLKADAVMKASGLPVLADDSGLMVDALDGAPGVYSARYAGEPCNHANNNAKLLRVLSGKTDRSARFRCVAALSDPAGRAETVSGSCPGRIVETLRGTQGFGYDPLFVPDGHEATFAEMGNEQKNTLSHRGRALALAKEKWGALIAANAPGFP